MRFKLLCILFIFLMPSIVGLDVNYLKNQTANYKIQDLEVANTDQIQIGYITDRKFNLIDSASGNIFSFSGGLAPSVDVLHLNNTSLWLFGVQYNNERVIIVNGDGKKIDTREVKAAYDRGAFIDKSTIFSSNTISPGIFNLNNNNEIIMPLKNAFATSIASRDFNDDGSEEILASGFRDYFVEIHRDGLKYLNKSVVPAKSFFVNDSKYLSVFKDKIELRYVNNHSRIWKYDIESYSIPRVENDGIYILDGKDLVKLDKKTGKIKYKTNLGVPSRKIILLGKNLVGVRRDDSLLIFSISGQLQDEITFSNKIDKLTKLDWNNDDKKDLVVTRGTKLSVLSIKEDMNKQVEKIKNDILYGNSKNILKGISLGKSVIISKRVNKREIKSRTSLTPVRASNVDWEEVSSGPRYYVDSREKAVYLSALLSEKNGTVVFEKQRADRDYSNYTRAEIEDLLIEKRDINHLVLADLDSEDGLLAASIASEQDALPVNSEKVSPVQAESPGEINQQSGFSSLEKKVERKFDEIGENKETVFEGRYISIVNGPRKAFGDPVPGLITSNRDGDVLYSDLAYGNLDGDRKLEASVGRYPEDTETASLLFYRSIKRERGGEALVASEYVFSNWPKALATVGGGVKSGKAAEKILENQNYNVTHLMEHRAKPIKLLKEISTIGSLLETARKLDENFSKFLSESASETVKNGYLVVKSLEYAEEGLKIYYEFKWEGYLENFSPELPDSANLEELEEFVDSVLPDRYPQLNSDSVVDEMKDSHLIYYTGIGNSERWIMPNEDITKIKDVYTGENNVSADEMSFKENAVLFDSSSRTATEDSKIKETFLENGSTYIGFTGNSYHAQTSKIALEFLEKGKTTGEGFRKGVNELRSSFLVYNPGSVHLPNVRQKMERTAALYGNPETPKDPVTEMPHEREKDCEEGICQVKVSIDTDYSIKEYGGNRTAVFRNVSSHLMQPYRPITPIYIYNEKMPENAELIEYSLTKNYSSYGELFTPVHVPVTHEGFTSENFSRPETFPVKTSRFNVSDEIEWVQAVQQKKKDETKVLETAELEYSYRAPVTLDLERENRTVEANVYSSEEQECKLYYRKNSGKMEERAVELEGSEKFNLMEVEAGKHLVEASLICDNEAVTDEKLITIEKPLNVIMFAPDIRKSEVRSVRAVVENDNSFKVEKTLKIKLGDNAILDLLEKPVKKLSIPADSSKRISWDVIGVSQGNSSAELGGVEVEFEVGEPVDFQIKNGPDLFLRKFETRDAKIHYEINNASRELEIGTRKAEVRKQQSSSKTVLELVTPDYIIKSVSTPENRVVKAESSGGEHIVKTENGRTRQVSKGVSEYEYRRMKEVFEREVEKLDKID